MTVPHGGLGLTGASNGTLPFATGTNTYSSTSLGTGLSYSGGAINVSLSPFTTSSLAEGSNLYYTASRFNSAFAAKTTDALPEGATNLYYTDVRADARITLQKGASNGIASLDAGAKVPLSQINTIDIAHGGTNATTVLQAEINLFPDTTNQSTKYLRYDGAHNPIFFWDTAGSSGGGGGGVTSVGVSGGSTGLTTSGGPITTSGTITIAGTLVPANGGTGLTTITNHGAMIGAGTGNVTTVAPGTSGNVFTSNGTAWTSAAPATSGTVTSVAISGPSVITWSGSPITSSGALTGTFASQSQNLVLASPDGSSGALSVRALVTGDLPTGIPNANLANSSITIQGSPVSLGGSTLATNSTPTFASETLTAVTNQLTLGTTNTDIISATAPSASRTLTIPDPGADASFVMTQGNQTLAGQKTFSTTIVGSITGNSGTVTNGVYTTGTNTLTGLQNLKKDNIKTTYTVAADLENTTASDATNTVQQSPTLEFDSHVWNTTSTATDSLVNVRITDVPTTGATTGGKLRIDFGNTGAGFTNVWSISDLGVQNVTGTYQIGGTDVLTSTTLGSGIVNSSLTSVGTIATGVWNGTTIAVANGGTNQTSYTNGQLLIGNTTGNTLAKSTLTAGSGISITNGAGSITINATAGISNPMTTTGDIIYSSDNSGTAARLGIGGSNTVLSGGTTPSYVTLATDATLLGNGIGTSFGIALTHANTWTGAITENQAGIHATYTNGLTLVNTTASLTGQHVEQSPSLLLEAHVWDQTATAADSIRDWRVTNVPISSTNPLVAQLVFDAGNAGGGYVNEMTLTDAGSLSVATGFRIANAATSGSYLRGNGTNIVLNTIQAGDVPTLNQNTTGTANVAGGTLGAIPYQSGANATTVLAATSTANKILLSGASAAPVWSTPTFPNASATSGKIIKSDGTNWVASTETYAAPGTSGNVMQSDGTNWTSAALTGMTNPMTTTGDMIYSSSGSTPARLAAGTAAQALIGGSSAPAWGATITAVSPTANTSFDGWVLTNTTAASNGNQMYSPRLHLTGQGWKTTATAASEAADWTIENRPVQGTSVPASQLVFSQSTNGGSYYDILTLAPLNGQGSNEAYIGSTGAQVQDIYFGYGKSGGGGTTSTLHASNGAGSNNPGAALALSAGLGTGTQLSGEVDFIESLVGSTGSSLNSTRTLMKLVPSGTAASTAKATLTLGSGSTADGNLVIANVTNNNLYTIVPAAPAASRTLTIQDPVANTNFMFEDGNTKLALLNGAARTISIADASSASGDNLTVQAGNGNGTNMNGGGLTLSPGLNTGSGSAGTVRINGITGAARYKVAVFSIGSLVSGDAEIAVGSTSDSHPGLISLVSGNNSGSAKIVSGGSNNSTYTIQDAGAAADFLTETATLHNGYAALATSTQGVLSDAKSTTAKFGSDVTFDNAATRTISIAAAAAATAGDQLTIKAGDGTGTDKNGGELQLRAGFSTGAGTPGAVNFLSSGIGSTGTSLNAAKSIGEFVVTSNTNVLGQVGNSTMKGQWGLQDGTGFAITLNPVALAASRTYTLQDAGAAADFLMETADLSANTYSVMTTSTRGV